MQAREDIPAMPARCCGAWYEFMFRDEGSNRRWSRQGNLGPYTGAVPRKGQANVAIGKSQEPEVGDLQESLAEMAVCGIRYGHRALLVLVK